jgi:hypothetical protein
MIQAKKILAAGGFAGFLLCLCACPPPTGGDPKEYHSVTVAQLEHGAISVSSSSAQEGETVTLTVNPESGYTLTEGSLAYNDGADHAISGTSFTMPNADVTVTAEFEQIPQVAEIYRGTYTGFVDESWTSFELTATTAILNGTTYTGIYTQGGGTVSAEGGGTYTYFYKDGTKIGVGAGNATSRCQVFFGIWLNNDDPNIPWGASPSLDFTDLGTSPLNGGASK